MIDAHIAAENVDKLDAYYKKLLDQGGIRVLVGEGENARVEIIDLPAAMCRAIQDRAKQLGVQKAASRDPLAHDDRPLPPVDEEGDDAATA